MTKKELLKLAKPKGLTELTVTKVKTGFAVHLGRSGMCIVHRAGPLKRMAMESVAKELKNFRDEPPGGWGF